LAQGKAYQYRVRLLDKSIADHFSIEVLEVKGFEALSRCFRYEVETVVSGPRFQVERFLGCQALLEVVASADKVIKRVHGIITQLNKSAAIQHRQQVSLLLEPGLARLVNTMNSRVFQNKTPLQILFSILKQHGFQHDYVESRILGNLPVKPFCLQFDESDLSFIERILREYGYFYFFKHTAKAHVMCLHNNAKAIVSDNPTLLFKPGNKLVADQEVIYDKKSRYADKSGSMLACSYRFSTFNWNLRRPMSAPDGQHKLLLHADAELPRSNLEDWSNARYVELHASDQLVSMLTTSRGLKAGDIFVLSQSGEEIQQYLIAELHLHCSQQGQAKQHAINQPANYLCRLECSAVENAYLPGGLLKKPRIHSVLTATVVAPNSVAESDFAPKGEEKVDSRYKPGDAYCDDDGRVLIQFSWQAVNNQRCKIWVRVSYPIAGPGHGVQHIPRIGDTVLVSFINGDPDTPIIIGSVYGQRDHFPHRLPKNHNKTLIRGRPHHERANEICFDDQEQRSSVTIVNAAGHRIRMDEVNACLSLETAGNHRLVLSDADKSLTIRSEHGHRIQLRDAGDSHAGQLQIESSAGHMLIFDNDKQAIQVTTRSGHRLQFDDKQQSIELSSANNQVIQIDDKNRSLQLKSHAGLALRLDDKRGVISLSDEGGQVELMMDVNKGDIRLSALGNVEISAPEGSLNLNAKRITMKSNDGLSLSSDVDLKVSAGNNLKISAASLHSEAEGEYSLQAQLIKLN